MKKDKWFHLLGALALTLLLSLYYDPLASSLISIFFWALKEGFDWVTREYARRTGKKPSHTPDPEDFVFSVIGSVLGMLAAILLENLL